MYNNCRLLDWQPDKISVVVGELSTLYHLLLFFDSIFGRRDLLIFKDLRDRKRDFGWFLGNFNVVVNMITSGIKNCRLNDVLHFVKVLFYVALFLCCNVVSNH